MTKKPTKLDKWATSNGLKHTYQEILLLYHSFESQEKSQLCLSLGIFFETNLSTISKNLCWMGHDRNCHMC